MGASATSSCTGPQDCHWRQSSCVGFWEVWEWFSDNCVSFLDWRWRPGIIDRNAWLVLLTLSPLQMPLSFSRTALDYKIKKYIKVWMTCEKFQWSSFQEKDFCLKKTCRPCLTNKHSNVPCSFLGWVMQWEWTLSTHIAACHWPVEAWPILQCIHTTCKHSLQGEP